MFAAIKLASTTNKALFVQGSSCAESTDNNIE